MSGIGTTQVVSNLPEDIEARLTQVQETVSIIDGKIVSAKAELASKEEEIKVLCLKISDATDEYNKKVLTSSELSKELLDREVAVAQKESALNVYANALEEKENKINKYLAIFENMKSVVLK